MKKPNITKGDWEMKNNGSYYDIINSGFSFISTIQNDVLESEIGLTEDVELANAKAISAVPDMIDELIDNIKLIQKLRDGYSVDREELNEHWTNTYYALKKAGCTK